VYLERIWKQKIVLFYNQCNDSAEVVDQIRFKSISSPHANAWLLAPPCLPLNLELKNAEFRTAVLRWLGSPISTSNSRCSACTLPLTPKASHAARCRNTGDLSSRHNRLQDIVFGLASNACLNPVKEKSGNLPSQPNRRPGDVYIPQFIDGKPAALDIAVTCPVQSKYASGRCVAAEDYALNVKHRSYDPGFVGTGEDFLPVVVDTFGLWGSEALLTINELITRGCRRLEIPFGVYGPQTWQKLSISLQRSNARMILSRLALF